MNQMTDLDIDQATEIRRQEDGRLAKPRSVVLTRNFWFILFVALPTLVAAFYYAAIASDEFISESQFVIKTPGQRNLPGFSLANLIQSSGVSAAQGETQEVIGYINSRSALADLGKAVNLRQAYADDQVDFLSRYPQPFEEDRLDNLFDYYRSKVSITTDAETGLITLGVRAFDPKKAQEANEQLLRLSESFVNRLNGRAQQQAIREAQKRVDYAEARLRKVRIAMAGYRNSQALIDPEKQASGILTLAQNLSMQRAELQSRLSAMERVAPRHPGIPALRSQISALSGSIAAQQQQVVGGGGAIASRLGSYEQLAVEQEFATQMLNAANATMEQAQAEAAKQQVYLQRIADPNLPDTAEYPKAVKRVLTIGGALFCIFLVGWMLVVGIIEHAPEK